MGEKGQAAHVGSGRWLNGGFCSPRAVQPAQFLAPESQIVFLKRGALAKRERKINDGGRNVEIRKERQTVCVGVRPGRRMEYAGHVTQCTAGRRSDTMVMGVVQHPETRALEWRRWDGGQRRRGDRGRVAGGSEEETKETDGSLGKWLKWEMG